MRVSVITPTCDRPVGFELLEMFMARQTRQPDEWVVADSGQRPVTCTRGQVHLEQPMVPGPRNFVQNVRAALERSTGDVIVCFEDDDCYQPMHLAHVVGLLETSDALVAGDDIQRYYNVQRRCWRTFENVGASLCQTAIRRVAVPLLLAALAECERKQTFGVDATLWKLAPTSVWRLDRTPTVTGVKGLPGQPGLGIGHRPDRNWTADPDLAQLRAWIGDDVNLYQQYGREAA